MGRVPDLLSGAMPCPIRFGKKWHEKQAPRHYRFGRRGLGMLIPYGGVTGGQWMTENELHG